MPINRLKWTAALILFILLFVLEIGNTNSVLSQSDELPFSPDDFQPIEKEQAIALESLPKSKKGYTDWVEAINQGIIKPRAELVPDPDHRPMPPIDFKVRFDVKADIPDVVFPHLPHTQWLDCRNCHPGIFLMKAGSNPISMAKILRGEFCGRCHGKVAFPISDCQRCHSNSK